MSLKDVTVAPELIEAALRYKNGSYIATEILPPLPVADFDGIYMKENAILPFTSLTTLHRGDDAVAQDIKEGTDSGTYLLEGWALRKFTSNKARQRAKGGFAIWLDQVGLRLEGLLRLRYEVATAALLMSDSVITNHSIPSVLWDVSTADIAKDFDTARDTAGITSPLNALACNDKVYRALRRSNSLKEILGFNMQRSKTQLLTPDEVKDALELQFLFVSDAKLKTAAGASSRIWGDHGLLFACDPSHANVQAVLGNSFTMAGQGYTDGIKAVRYPDAENRGGGGEWAEVENLIDPIIYDAASTAYRFVSVVS